MTATPERLAHCAFCFHVTNYGPGGDGVRIVVRREDENAFQQDVFAHVFCLAGRLHPGVRLEVDLFGEDWAEVMGRFPARLDAQRPRAVE